jgi:heterokaryon incompatibility protein (HET)
VLSSDLGLEHSNNNSPIAPTYAALTYCWGSKEDSKEQVTATTQSLPGMLSRIDDQRMSAALRDAISVTRSLSIPFLWVDALCIFQDSDDDWERQSSLMDKIYGNAHVTIGAAASNSCKEQFIHAKRKELYLSYRSRLNPEAEGVLRLVYLRAVRENSVLKLDDADVIHSNINKCKWNIRGWTYQEFTMSTRFLGFGSSALCFSCPTSGHHMGGTERPSYRFHLASLESDEPASTDYYSMWDHIIEEYSGRSGGYTDLTDTLPALSGVASYMSNKLGANEGDYVAGLWKLNLFSSLAWRILDTRSVKMFHLTDCIQSMKTSNPYVAPSCKKNPYRIIDKHMPSSRCRYFMWIIREDTLCLFDVDLSYTA